MSNDGDKSFIMNTAGEKKYCLPAGHNDLALEIIKDRNQYDDYIDNHYDLTPFEYISKKWGYLKYTGSTVWGNTRMALWQGCHRKFSDLSAKQILELMKTEEGRDFMKVLEEE
jgi:hypothetical protein